MLLPKNILFGKPRTIDTLRKGQSPETGRARKRHDLHVFKGMRRPTGNQFFVINHMGFLHACPDPVHFLVILLQYPDDISIQGPGLHEIEKDRHGFIALRAAAIGAVFGNGGEYIRHAHDPGTQGELAPVEVERVPFPSSRS